MVIATRACTWMSLGSEEMSRFPRYSMLHEMSERLGPGHISEWLSLHGALLGQYLDGLWLIMYKPCCEGDNTLLEDDTFCAALSNLWIKILTDRQKIQTWQYQYRPTVDTEGMQEEEVTSPSPLVRLLTSSRPGHDTETWGVSARTMSQESSSLSEFFNSSDWFSKNKN